MELLKSKTYENLAKAYAGECQARTRYEFIEYGARNEGFAAMANLIDKVAFNEFNHARMFYSFIQSATKQEIDNIVIESGYPFKEKWNLLDNLKFAAQDENNEAERIYPEFERVAREEGFTDIANLFKNVTGVEKCHKMLFEQLYTQLKDGTLYSKKEIVKWKCGDCGYEAMGKTAFEVCPLCGAKQGRVLLKIEDDAQ
ncbi:MAG: rubrerythrin family protein [Christensenellales bacterium]